MFPLDLSGDGGVPIRRGACVQPARWARGHTYRLPTHRGKGKAPCSTSHSSSSGRSWASRSLPDCSSPPRPGQRLPARAADRAAAHGSQRQSPHGGGPIQLPFRGREPHRRTGRRQPRQGDRRAVRQLQLLEEAPTSRARYRPREVGASPLKSSENVCPHETRAPSLMTVSETAKLAASSASPAAPDATRMRPGASGEAVRR
jgi:hypothetical protein